MRSRWGILGLLAAGVVAVSGCVPGTLPLSIPNGTSVCADSDLARSGSFGLPITNTSSTAITLSDAGPNSVTDLDVDGVWIVQAVDNLADAPVFGDDATPGNAYVQWDTRADPDGAVIDAGSTSYLIVAVTLSEGSDAGALEGFRLQSGGNRVVVPDTGYGLSPAGASCPWSPPGGDASPSPSETTN